MQTNKFYDIHFHTMDLSHANITAFADRFIKNETKIIRVLKKILPWWKKILGSLLMPLLGILIPYSTLAKFISNYINSQSKVRNLLSFMETTILYDFLIVEYFLKNEHKNQKAIVSNKNEFEVGGNTYNKIVLCPLIMDFGYPNLKNNNYFYNIPPQKPVTNQIKDLFEAIKTYYTKEITICNNGTISKFEISDTTINKEKKLFEIYPFMGINTANYTITEIAEMLEKYFCDFSDKDTYETRYNKLYNALGTFVGNFDDKENCKNIFAGIKLYPPLGFNPWPSETDKTEKEKVEFLYCKCIEKNIPIITHCSTGGFIASPLHKEFTNPNTKWEMVLNDKRFTKLKIDFAHLGEDDIEWTNKILTLATNPNNNVYADFSSNGCNPNYYNKLKNQLASANKNIEDKILYGSDFMINLLNVNSLNEYMEYFINTTELTDKQKRKFVNSNPEKFLFGE